MGLHVPSLQSREVLQLPEDFAKRRVRHLKGILMRSMALRVSRDNQHLSRDGQLDAHAIVSALAFAVMRTWRLDGNVTTGDARVEALELGGPLSNERIERIGRVAVTIADLKMHLHGILSFVRK